ncbi:hypothetical protein Tco_0410471 [Tanacetum coccineum]
MLIWRPCDAGIINIYWKNHYVGAHPGYCLFVRPTMKNIHVYVFCFRYVPMPVLCQGSFSKLIVAANNTGILARPSVGGRNKHCLLTPVSWRGSYTWIVAAAMAKSENHSPQQPPQAYTAQTDVLLPFNYSTDINSNDHRFGVPVRRAWAPSLRMSFHQRHQKLLQLLPSGGKRKYTPHSEGLNKLCDNCVHNISQCTPTHKFGHGSVSNEMTKIVSKPLIVCEIAETNGNTVNIAARTCSNVKTSILTHSQHPHCLTSKRIQFPTTVSRLCPINKLAHLLFGTRKIPIHAHPRLCIVLSCTTLLKAVYRGGKTTPTTGGGSNEFRIDDEPNTTKRRRVLPQIIVFMMFAFICFTAITYERKAGILAGLLQLDCCCNQSNLASRVAVMVSGRSNVTRLWLNIECILLGCDDLSNMLCCCGQWKDGSV